MPRPTVIQDEGEVRRWFDEGKTYREMSELYLEKYNLEVGISTWGTIRRRLGLERRHAWDRSLIPWTHFATPQHASAYPIQMLRREARRRSGLPVSDDVAASLDSWIDGMKLNDTVVHYDPDTEAGWFYVPRRPGVDRDLIRMPDPEVVRKLDRMRREARL